ncbi:MAG: Transcriptional regulator, GntR family [Labilithrix sp.]|nr:Transcriptional regulator, GntR family [Labilithrix sp.]
MTKEGRSFDTVTRPHADKVRAGVADKVVAELRRSIVFGSLEPGREFSLRETAAHLGVSTAPVREALRVLHGEGLIVTRRARSAVVAPLDAAELAAIYRLRRLIEPDLAARSCPLLTCADLEGLAAMVTVFGSPDVHVDEIYETHRRFHLALLGPAATPLDMRIIETLWHAAERYVRVGLIRPDPAPLGHRRRETSHRSVLDAFRTGDGEQARRALATHLEDNELVARRAITPAGGAPS